jgi:tetratricopeptide (TPR) repeat protein
VTCALAQAAAQLLAIFQANLPDWTAIAMQSSATDGLAAGEAEPDYAAQFVENVHRSVRATLIRVQQDPNPVLGERTRERALHVLSFAFKLPAVWPQIRELLLALAPKLEQAGYRGEWLPYLVQGVALSEAAGDALAGAELRLYIGHLHRLQSRWGPARELLTASAAAFAALDERRGQARALNQLAYVAWQQHRHDEAQRLAHQALGLLAERDIERAMSLSVLGLAAVERHRWQEGEEYHRAALRIRTDHGDQRLVAWSLQNLGYALRGQGKYAAASDCYETAIATLTALQDEANCAVARLNLGIVYSLQGEPARALAVYSLAEAALRRIGDEWHLAKVLTNQGIDYLALGEWQLAERVFLASTTLFQRLGDQSEFLNALDGLGLSYLEGGNYHQALIAFETVKVQLPQIVGTRAHPLLEKVIDNQLERARAARSQTPPTRG